MIDNPDKNNILANGTSTQNQTSSSSVALEAKKSNTIIISGIVLLAILLFTSAVSYIFQLRLKSTKNILIPTPTTIATPSPTTIMKEEYANPFAPTGTTDKQYSNPFEQTDNPFDELAK